MRGRQYLTKLSRTLLIPSKPTHALCVAPIPSFSSPPRSFHTTPALYALIRSTALKKKEDLFTTAQQEAKKGKLTSEKVAGFMNHPDLTGDLAVKIFDLALKQKLVNTDVCGAVLQYLRDKKQPQHVNYIWGVINQNNISLSIPILEVVYEAFSDAGDTDKMFEIIEKLNTLKPPTPRFYNGIVDLFMGRNERDKAFAVIEKLKEHGGKPDSMTYLVFECFYDTNRFGLILKELDAIKDFDLIVETYKKMRADGVRPSGITVFFMIEAYGKNGMYDKAVEMFDIGKGMGLRMSINPYISVIRYLGKAGQVKRAYDTFELILTDRLQRGPVCYHTIIEVFTSHNFLADALQMLQKMLREGYKPSLPTFSLILDPLFPGNDVAGVGQVVEAMRGAKVKPDEAMMTKFAEFESRNQIAKFWSEPSK